MHPVGQVKPDKPTLANSSSVNHAEESCCSAGVSIGVSPPPQDTKPKLASPRSIIVICFLVFQIPAKNYIMRTKSKNFLSSKRFSFFEKMNLKKIHELRPIDPPHIKREVISIANHVKEGGIQVKG